MRNTVFLFFLFLLICKPSIAQKEKVQPEIGVSGLVGAFGWYNGNKVHDFSPDEGDNKSYESGNGYVGYNLKLGATFHLKNKSLNISLLYQFISSRDGRAITFKRSHLYSNLIGLSGSLTFFEDKKLHLIAGMNIMSECATNYKDKFLLQKQYTPANIPDPNKYLLSDFFTMNIYKGTPFIGDILIGGGLLISKGLSLNLMFGYGVRLLRSQEALVKIKDVFVVGQIESYKVAEVQAINSPYLVAFHMLNFQLGLSYTFSFKKKTKTETP